MDNGSNCIWRPKPSGVLLESVLRHDVLNMSINDLGEVPEHTLVEFAADDAKLGGPGDTLEGKGCHPAGPRPAEGTGQQKLYEIEKEQMQIPAPGKEKTPAVIQAGDCLAGE